MTIRDGSKVMKKASANLRMDRDRRRYWKTGSDALVSLLRKDHTHAEMDAIVSKSKALSSEEIDSVRAYSGSSYIPINNVLYNVDKDGLNQYEKGTYTGSELNRIKAIDSATDQKINKPLVLYRGEGIRAINNMLGGKPITDANLKGLEGQVMALKGFASTAYRASDSFHDKPVFIEINAPKGVQGRVITDISKYHHYESELLLHNSGGLKFNKVYRDKNGQIIIKADYLF